MYIPEKLENVKKVKKELKTQLLRAKLDTNVKFREIPDLIKKVPDSGAMTQDDINTCANILININGENA